MREGALTEREWRRQAYRQPRRDNRCWGAQCMAPQSLRRKPAAKKSWRLAVWTLGTVMLGMGGLFTLWFNTPTHEFPVMPALSATVESLPSKKSVRANSAVVYRYPETDTRELTFSRAELLRGKIMLIDKAHPIPSDAPGANTLCIAAQGKGMVPVRDLTIKTGRQTIDALYQMFFDARQKGIEGLVVWRGTASATEQREMQLERVRLHSASMSLAEAVERAREEIEDPCTSDFQQQYTVDIRLYETWNGTVDDRGLGLTEQGRYLMQNAWRYGFVRRFPEESDDPFRAYRFRYVGVAHSTAMTYLDLDLEAYLDLLHEKGVVLIHQNGKPIYLIICKKVQEDCATVKVPVGAAYEAGYDNMGYAIVACTFLE